MAGVDSVCAADIAAVVTLATVPHLGGVYSAAPDGILLDVLLFGAGWGVAQVFFGLAVDAIGIALTFSLVMGISAAMGTLVPLVRSASREVEHAGGPRGAVRRGAGDCGRCAVRHRRTKEGTWRCRWRREKKNAAVGLALAILCGFGAAFVNFGLAFGAPL